MRLAELVALDPPRDIREVRRVVFDRAGDADRRVADLALLDAGLLQKAADQSSQSIGLECRIAARLDELGTRGGVGEETQPGLGAADGARQSQ